MGFRYEWKELTRDGLLKEPEKCGPHYNQESLNGYGGFESEEEAVREFETYKKNYGFGVPRELVLVRIYEIENKL